MFDKDVLPQRNMNLCHRVLFNDEQSVEQIRQKNQLYDEY